MYLVHQGGCILMDYARVAASCAVRFCLTSVHGTAFGMFLRTFPPVRPSTKINLNCTAAHLLVTKASYVCSLGAT